MRYLSVNAWNLMNDKQNEEIDVEAEEGDIVFEIGGIFFLAQTRNGYNNIICKRITRSKMTFAEVIVQFKKVMEECELQYIRVEGNTKRYKFLTKLLPQLFDDKVGIIKDEGVDDRNVFYIKTY